MELKPSKLSQQTPRLSSDKSPSERSEDSSAVERGLRAVAKAESFAKSGVRLKSAKSGAQVSDEVARLALKLFKTSSQKSLNWKDDQIPVTDIVPFLRQFRGDDSEYIFHTIGQGISSVNKNKIMAIMACMESDLPFHEWHVFEKTGETFNNQLPNFTHVQPLTPGECAWTARCMKSIRDIELSDEVKTYIAHCLHDDGMFLCPTSLAMCQPELSRVTGITDLEPLKSLYLKKQITHPQEMIRIQLQRLAAIDAYLEEKAVLK